MSVLQVSHDAAQMTNCNSENFGEICLVPVSRDKSDLSSKKPLQSYLRHTERPCWSLALSKSFNKSQAFGSSFSRGLFLVYFYQLG